MPTPAFMTLRGERQGLISAGAFTEASVGNVYQVGREDRIMIQALSHGIFVPNGSGSGRRMHKPLIITTQPGTSDDPGALISCLRRRPPRGLTAT